jgi:hypothetical protein
MAKVESIVGRWGMWLFAKTADLEENDPAPRVLELTAMGFVAFSMSSIVPGRL